MLGVLVIFIYGYSVDFVGDLNYRVDVIKDVNSVVKFSVVNFNRFIVFLVFLLYVSYKMRLWKVKKKRWIMIYLFLFLSLILVGFFVGFVFGLGLRGGFFFLLLGIMLVEWSEGFLCVIWELLIFCNLEVVVLLWFKLVKRVVVLEVVEVEVVCVELEGGGGGGGGVDVDVLGIEEGVGEFCES